MLFFINQVIWNKAMSLKWYNAKHFQQKRRNQEKNGERIMHCVPKLQRNIFPWKSSIVSLFHTEHCRHEGRRNAPSAGFRLKEFRSLGADRNQGGVFYMKSDTQSRNQQMLRKKLNLPSKFKMYSINTKK